MDTKVQVLIFAREEIQLFCAGITALLQQESRLHVEQRSYSRETFATVPATRPDLIIFFPTHAIPAPPVRTMNFLKGHAKLLLVFGPGVKYTLRHLQDLEADGAISSSATRTELLLAINIILFKGLKYVSPHLIGTLIQPANHEPWGTLSKNEKNIALLMANGRRNIDIAAELSISQKTVSTYKARIYRKLGVCNAVQLLRFWQQSNSEQGVWE